MQHPQWCSLGNVVTKACRLVLVPGDVLRYAEHYERLSFWAAYDLFLADHLPDKCPRIWLSSLRVPFSVHGCGGYTLLRSATPFHFAEWVLRSLHPSSMRTVSDVVTPQHRGISSSDFVRVCRLDNCFIHFAMLPRSSVSRKQKLLRPYNYINALCMPICNVTYLINALPDSSSVNTVHYATVEEVVFSVSSAPSNGRNGVVYDQFLGYATPR
jgi:hypothetical protein